ncbi:MAG: PP2C family serine/threonine-protein phosphatase [Hyphomicrobiaceae bacterium]
MAEIFLSFWRSDSLGSAGRLADRLRAELGPAHVHLVAAPSAPGDDSAARVGETAGESVLVVALGRDWQEPSGNCQDEAAMPARIQVAEALARKSKVVTALIDGAQPPATERLPPDLVGLAQLPAVHIEAETFDADVVRLVELLRGLTATAAPLEAGNAGEPASGPVETIATKREETTIPLTSGVETRPSASMAELPLPNARGADAMPQPAVGAQAVPSRMRLDLATADYIGARAEQQDLAAAAPLPGGGALLVLADGLGGHHGGAEAARLVVDTFRDAAATGRFGEGGSPQSALREAMDKANARILEALDPGHGHRGMASTLVGAVLASGGLGWISVGDSHLYLWRDGRLVKLNEDHSQAGLMVRSGQWNADDPEVLAVRSVLVSALTGRSVELVDLPPKRLAIREGDIVVLASDGLNTLEDAEIAEIVGNHRMEGATRVSIALLEAVRARRVERQDNATVVVARVLAAAAATDPGPNVLRLEETPAVARSSEAQAKASGAAGDAALSGRSPRGTLHEQRAWPTIARAAIGLALLLALVATAAIWLRSG